MNQFNTNKQKGFSILAVILVIVAVIVAIGVWALSGQTNTSSSGNKTNDIKAAAIINDGAAIKLAFDTLVINGSNANSITLIPNTASTPAIPNLADPTNGIQITKLNSKFLNDNPAPNAGLWMLKTIDYTTFVSQVVMISGLNEDICKRINFQLHGVSAIPNLPTGNNNTYWIFPTYTDTDSLLMNIDSVSSYDGQGDINLYTKFEQDLLNYSIPASLCISLGYESTYAFYYIVKK